MPIFGSEDESTEIERADPSEYIWVCDDCDCIHSGEPEVCLNCTSGRLTKHKRETYNTDTNHNISVTEIGDGNEPKSAMGILIQDNTSITLVVAFIVIILALSAFSLLFQPNIIITVSLAIVLILTVMGFFVYRFITQT